MCTIIHKLKGLKFPDKDFLAAFKMNSDGFGFMYFDDKTGRVVAQKGVYTDPEDILKIVKDHVDKEVIYHFRRRTHGDIGNSQCHPFKVTDSKKHGMDMYFMHNGTIPTKDFVMKDGESDTQAFNRSILVDILTKKPTLIKSEAFHRLIEPYVNSSRLVFMFGNGKVVKVNEKLGSEWEGCWVSTKAPFTSGTMQTATRTSRNCYDDNRKSHSNVTHLPVAVMGPIGILMGAKVNVDDIVYIYYSQSDVYEEQGRIVRISGIGVTVVFKDAAGLEKQALFAIETGEGLHQASGYSIIPTGGWPETDRIKGYTPPRGDSSQFIQMSGGKMSNMEDKLPFDKTADATKNMLKQDSDKKKEANSSVVSVELEAGLIEIDSGNRWGNLGVCMNLTSDLDYDGTSILDIYNMQPQERLEFMLYDVDRAFGMFQDLIENKVNEDTSNEKLKQLEDKNVSTSRH